VRRSRQHPSKVAAATTISIGPSHLPPPSPIVSKGTTPLGSAYSPWDSSASANDSESPQSAGAVRDRTAEDRDAFSETADDISRVRDEQAQVRDEAAELREFGQDDLDAEASSDRAAARRDREASAGDRVHSLHDRVLAGADRILSSIERSDFLIDDLTGAHRRSAGLLELEREITRAHRSEQMFSLAFIDVDGLKRVNDSNGHLAGDQLLTKVIQALRSHVRPYDLVVRYGGDEFLCGLLDMDLKEAGRRIALVNDQLEAGGTGRVTAGLARLEAGDTLAALILRADEDLYRRRAADHSRLAVDSSVGAKSGSRR
jgi:diguanylate cyclase (GGDEF)-like protein